MRDNKRCGWTAVLVIGVALAVTTASAADLEMVDGYGNITGMIDVSRQGLSVFETSGDRFFYRRARQYDLPGGRYLGFYNLELNRIVRFPRNGIGPIERADLDSPFPQFVPGMVTVRPIGSGPGFAPFLNSWLGVPGGGFVPYGIGSFYGDPFFGGGHFGGGRYGLGHYGFGSTVVSGYLSTGISLNVGPIGMGPSPLMSAIPTMQPQSTLIESRVVESQRLPPVEIAFANTTNETLIVTLTDTHHPGRQPEYKIPPGESQRVKLPRDGSQTRIDAYQTFDPSGEPVRREVEVALDPEPRYEVAVQRVRIQSIAIDRTGKSPNVIEDINMQGIAVGRFALPPGDQLVAGTINVFTAATRN